MKTLTVIRVTLDVVVQRQGEALPGAAEVAQRIEGYLPGLTGGAATNRNWFVNAVRCTGAEEREL